jgi:hypothetical protein
MHNVVRNIDSLRMSCGKIWNREVTNWKQFKTRQKKTKIKTKTQQKITKVSLL